MNPNCRVLAGKPVAEKIYEKLSSVRTSLKQSPKLVVLLVGNDPASHTYVRNKKKRCELLGFVGETIELEESISAPQLVAEIEKLNRDASVHGILVQLPLPSHLNAKEIIEHIDPNKDVDGITAKNVGLLWQNRGLLKSCTPAGVIEMLEYYAIPIEGQKAVVVGRSEIVGKPMAQMLLEKNATVTICHSRTKKLAQQTTQADILIAAIGKPKFFNADHVKASATVIDVGIHRVDGKLVGDVDFESVQRKAQALSPVPGGVGPMTIAMLMHNVCVAAKLQQ